MENLSALNPMKCTCRVNVYKISKVMEALLIYITNALNIN